MLETIRSDLLECAKELSKAIEHVEIKDMKVPEYCIEYLEKLRDYDECTYRHSLRTAIIIYLIERRFNIHRDNGRVVGGALLHDIGKTAIPLKILNKPSTLSHEEREIIDMHSAIGYEMVSKDSLVSDLERDIILFHHFNRNKLGTRADIVEYVIMADRFDAMLSNRPYRKGMEVHKILKILEKEIEKDKTDKLKNLLKV